MVGITLLFVFAIVVFIVSYWALLRLTGAFRYWQIRREKRIVAMMRKAAHPELMHSIK
jgi:hypothetical protein